MYRILILGLLGCASSKENTTIQVEEVARDNDGDGFDSDEDCDDSNSTINPGASEVCDGVDNDCSGEVDDGALIIFYGDSDEDGYGNPDIVTEACYAPAGFVSTGTDCDDTNEESYPGADEICDDLDNNCDGAIDEGLSEVFFADNDDDGFGDEDNPIEACGLSSGLSAIVGDCDDSDAMISPVASELCDGIDNDCDGDTDEDVARAFYADTDSDGYGDPSNVLEACELPSGYSENTLDCDDSDSQINPAADEYCDEQDNDCDGDTDEDFSVDALLFLCM